MANSDIEISRAIESGDEVVEAGFAGSVRQLGPNTFKVGDLFRIPTDFKVLKNSSLTTDEENPVLYTFVELMASKTKSTGNARQLYPSMFQRTVYAYTRDDDGKVVRDTTAANGLGYIVAGGKAVEEFQSHSTVQEAMTALAGKVIKVTDIRTVNTRSYVAPHADGSPIDPSEYDLVEGKTFVLDFA